MSPDQILLDPTSEISPEKKPKIGRPGKLDGLTVGLLDINKPRGDEFLDRIEELLGEKGISVNRYKKERFSRVAAPELRSQIAEECQVAIEALAD
jgi:hypothetical protein